jgi:hypothetical protein
MPPAGRLDERQVRSARVKLGLIPGYGRTQRLPGWSGEARAGTAPRQQDGGRGDRAGLGTGQPRHEPTELRAAVRSWPVDPGGFRRRRGCLESVSVGGTCRSSAPSSSGDPLRDVLRGQTPGKAWRPSSKTAGVVPRPLAVPRLQGGETMASDRAGDLRLEPFRWRGGTATADAFVRRRDAARRVARAHRCGTRRSARRSTSCTSWLRWGSPPRTSGCRGPAAGLPRTARRCAGRSSGRVSRSCPTAPPVRWRPTSGRSSPSAPGGDRGGAVHRVIAGSHCYGG